MREKKKNIGRDSLILLSVLVVVTLLLCIPYTNKYFIGVFGYAVYPYMIGAYALLFCSAKKMKLRVNKRNVILYSLTVVSLILTLHIGLAKELISDGWTGYIAGVFNFPTVGGMIFSLLSCYFVIPLGYLASLIIAFIIFSILLFVVIYPMLTVKPIERKKNGKGDNREERTTAPPVRLTVENLPTEPVLPVEEEELDPRSPREKAREILFIKKNESKPIARDNIQPLYGERKYDLLDRVEPQKISAFRESDLLEGEVGILVHPNEETYYVSGNRDKNESRRKLFGVAEEPTRETPPPAPTPTTPITTKYDTLPLTRYSPLVGKKPIDVDAIRERTLAATKPNEERVDSSLYTKPITDSSLYSKPIDEQPSPSVYKQGLDSTYSPSNEKLNNEAATFVDTAAVSHFDDITSTPIPEITIVPPKTEAISQNPNEEIFDMLGKRVDSSGASTPKNRIDAAIEFLKQNKAVEETKPENREVSPTSDISQNGSRVDAVSELPIRVTPSVSKPVESLEQISTKKQASKVLPKDNTASKPVVRRPYMKPYPGLLDSRPIATTSGVIEEYPIVKHSLEKRMRELGVEVDVFKAIKGPRVTRYFLKLGEGVPVKKALAYVEDMAMVLKSENGPIDIQAPILGQDAFGIDIPNKETENVGFREVFESAEYQQKGNGMFIALGKTTDGKNLVVDIDKMPHLLVAGSTGGGKSVCSNVIIMSLLMNCTPDEVRMLLVDPKKVELSFYEYTPHMLIPRSLTEGKDIVKALRWVSAETKRRYDLLTSRMTKKLSEYNDIAKREGFPTLPRILVLIDEANELMMFYKKEVENTLSSLASIGRAAGVHLIFATQSPSRNVITSAIQNNINVRIACRVSDHLHSMLILKKTGAQKLLGNGDMFLLSGNEMTRFQCSYVSDEEISRVTDFLRDNNDCIYDESISNAIYNVEQDETVFIEDKSGVGGVPKTGVNDDRIKEALKVLINSKKATISFIQRRLKLGFNAASDIIEELEKLGFVSHASENSAKARKVLITKQKFIEMYPEEANLVSFACGDDDEESDDND